MATIRDSIDAAVGYLTEHPHEARYTDSMATATLREGLEVEVGGPGGERALTDMPASVGGSGAAPPAGWLFRAALASCVTTLIAMRAAQQGVALSTLRVTVDSESDDRGILGIDPSVPAGPLSMRIGIDIEAVDTDDGALGAIVDWGVEHCPVYDAIRRSVEVSITR